MPIVERAFELARAGQFRDVKALLRGLASEGYSSPASYIQGTSLRKQLRDLMNAEKQDV